MGSEFFTLDYILKVNGIDKSNVTEFKFALGRMIREKLEDSSGEDESDILEAGIAKREALAISIAASSGRDGCGLEELGKIITMYIDARSNWLLFKTILSGYFDIRLEDGCLKAKVGQLPHDVPDKLVSLLHKMADKINEGKEPRNVR